MNQPPTPSGPADPIQQAMIARARAHLAQLHGIRPSEIRLVELTAVEWRNTGLGCPQPDMMYAQVITPGFRIVLEADGHMYEFHTDREQLAVLCKLDGLSVYLRLPVDPEGILDGKPWMPAD